MPEDSARGDCAGRRGEGLQGASQVGGAVDDVDGLAAGGEIVELGEAMADGLDVEPLITHTFGIDEAQRAFETAGDRTTGSSKVLIELG